MARALLLLQGALWVQLAGSHTLCYYYSSVSGERGKAPEFSIVGLVDDVPIATYSSETRECKPKARWMDKMESSYWEGQTSIAQKTEDEHRADVQTIMSLANQTQGVHTLQMMFGCEVADDGSYRQIYEYAYDGQDASIVDEKGVTNTAAYDPARIAQGTAVAQQWKAYLQGTCKKDLATYLQHGEESFLRRDPPGTKVCRRKSGEHTFLICYAYGFYPREIEVKWIRNGVEMPLESSQLLPNPDGTYQIKTMVEVHEGEDEKIYKGQVEHSSLQDIVTVVYEEKHPPTLNYWIIGIILGCVLLAFPIIGAFFYRKRYLALGQTDSSSSSS
ncbi:BOLA class I histocompatibility antigen, alpha chain BL3-7-like [Ambystoma mexicanum]|uniref:BOLA class I histocompatibility antigen, alpha chain BL3-7-like n=1 Tax=Ambystoma mexicanum TaxID=8296 RepID=UPI0037E76281